MPIKVFKCERCGVEKEVTLKLKDKDPKVCECNGELKRVYSKQNLGVSFSEKFHNW